MLIATLFFTGMQTAAKALSDFPVFQVLFFRSSITALFCVAFLKSQGISLKGYNQKLLILRAILGILSMSLFFITLQRMPFGASVSLKYLSPIFTAIFAVLILKEKVKSIQWLFFLGALSGVVLLKGFDARIDNLNLILGILGAVFGGGVYVVIRKIGQSEHSMVIINYFMLSAAILTGLLMIPDWKKPSLYQWMLLISTGIFGYFAQIYMTKAFQIESASRIAQLKYLEVIYSLIIGLIWFGEGYSWLSLIGILLILVFMILNVLVKNSNGGRTATP